MLIVRTLLFGVVGLLWGVALGIGWLTVVAVALGLIAGYISDGNGIGLLTLVFALAAFIVLAIFGVGTVSTVWTVVAAIALVVVFFLDFNESIDTNPTPARAY